MNRLSEMGGITKCVNGCVAIVGFAALFLLTNHASCSEVIPKSKANFFEQFCFDCHSGDDPESGIDLERESIDWDLGKAVSFWEQVYEVLEENEMPPRKSSQPSDEERTLVLDWLEGGLLEHSPVGGTVLRRLNRIEYQNTIRDLFGLTEFVVPNSFPSDDSQDGFDSVGEGLVLSPPLMAQYLEIATLIADEILPPLSPPRIPEPKRYEVGASGLATDKDAGAGLVEGRYRLASSRGMASAAGWPARFEAPESGVYRLTVELQDYQTDRMFYDRRASPFSLAIYARKNGEQFYDFFKNLRELARFDLSADSPAPVSFSQDIELYRSEVFGLRWSNGPAYSDPPVREFSTNFLADRLLKDRRYYAAMLEVRGGARGTTQSELYDQTRAAMERDDLDLTDPRLDSLPKVWGGGLSDAPHNWIKTYVLEELHRFGPALDVVNVVIEGPLELVEDEETRIQKARASRFLGDRSDGVSDRAFVERVLIRFLPQVFRREVETSMIQSYLDQAMTLLDSDSNARVEDALHLAIRRALISPQFLYRSVQEGRLDDEDLAVRLSYFLSSSAPDEQLQALARQGALSDSQVLADETRRLLKSKQIQSFVENFTGQWLGSRKLKDIMPDPRLLPFFDYDRQILIEETQLFFAEILNKNLPIEMFIDPDFSFRNEGLNKIYGGDLKGGEMRKVVFEPGGRHGGILGLGSVMMATANGVDTQPILRGVWLLENVLGMPTPAPPANVAAIAPDTTGTTTVRELLAAHKADVSCARCHDMIDPLGMVLENFDPVGRWRDHYPVYSEPKDEPLKEEFYKNIGKGTRSGPVVDSRGEMPDGFVMEDVTDLKRYLIERIDLFSRCLIEKLLIYGTGRSLGFGDQRVVDELVEQVKAKGNGFRDLIVTVIQSEVFRTK